MREGVRSLAEESTAMTAGEWRAFWQLRGMAELRLVLWASWEPLAGTLPGYDRYPFRIASLLGSRASADALAEELGRIRRDELGLEPDPAGDARAAAKIADWFAHSVGTRGW
jgi:hypothetical protein